MKPSQLCVLCGKRAATTRDHIPPKSIYPEPRDNDINFYTVPACLECNGGHSAADEEFKVLITFDTSHKRGDEDLLLDSLAHTVGGNQRIAKKVFGSAQRVYGQLGGSKTLQPAVAVDFDKDAYESVISRIVRGLHWREKREILPESAQITVRPYRGMPANLATSFEEAIRYGRLHFMNKRTFAYRCLFFSEEQTSIWGMCFFQSHIAFAYVTCRDEGT